MLPGARAATKKKRRERKKDKARKKFPAARIRAVSVVG
jgi:hypothetical protein